jgi:tetratricopeptide (TPR) repeat protein
MADGFKPSPKGDPASQLKVYLSAAGKAPANRWEPYFALARVQAQVGQPAESLKSLEIAQKRHAPRYKVAFVRGQVLGMNGDLEGAEKWLRQAFEKTPDTLEEERDDAAFNLGFCLEQRGRLVDAIACYRALKVDVIRAGIAVARCLRLGQDYEGGIKAASGALAKAQESNRESGDARAEIARSTAALGRIDEALKWMESAVKVSGNRFVNELAELRARSKP